MSPQVIGDASRMAHLTPAERKTRVDAAIRSIVARLPAAERAETEKLFQSEAVLFGMGTSDPSFEPDMRTIMDARAAESAELEAAAKAARRPELPSDRVNVAIVDKLPVAGARAVVRLNPDDRRMPWILLQEGAYTGHDVRRALRAASIMLQRSGADSTKRLQIVVKASTRPDDHPDQSAQAMKLMEAAGPGTIPGIGKARIVGMRIARPQPKER